MKRLLLVAAVSVPAAAFTFGGWAVTTVEDVPEYVVAGRSFDLTYTVRQHGVSLVSGLGGALIVKSGNTTQTIGAIGLGEGMYRAKVTLLSAGTWDVAINSGFMNSGVTLPLRVVATDAPAPPAMPSTDRGRQLFLAKGCVTCHTHQLTRDFGSSKVGPDLTEPKFSSAYLTRFLANPSIKTDWRTDQRMPNLGLKPAEIGALVAFLNQEKK